MKFLQKMLLILMISIATGNANIQGMIPLAGTVPVNLLALTPGDPILDFDTIVAVAGFGAAATIIPESLQPKLYVNPVAGAPTKRCVYFTVINNAPAPPGPAAFQVAIPKAPNVATEHNIYFPSDGSQPTTAEAVKWSCANIDNRENSPITEWYMMMFGVIPLDAGGAFVQAGWNNAAHPVAQQIISFHASVDGTNVNDPDAAPGAPQITRQQLFIQNFQKIASTSVGRVLLYRILIEIRRHNPGNNIGCTERQEFVSLTQGTAADDRCRSIEIMYMASFGFSSLDKAIFFYMDSNNLGETTPLIFSVIGKSEVNYTHIVQLPTKLDVAIFHEMIHWFHHLRNPVRYNIEVNTVNTLVFRSASAVTKHYWDGVATTTITGKDKITEGYARIWSAAVSRRHLDFEEMRNLLGMPHNCLYPDYLNGDDLSENLYRINKGLPLRFGYSGNTFYEDKKVTDRVLNTCVNNYIIYMTVNHSVDFIYGTGTSCFGKCKVHS